MNLSRRVLTLLCLFMRFVSGAAFLYNHHGTFLSRRWVRPYQTFASSVFQTATNSTDTIITNEERAARRISVARAKKEARQKSVQEVQSRHLHLQRQLAENATSLYALKVSVCQDLREELKLSGREKRGRAFIERGADASRELRALRFELHSFFRALRKSTYVLFAGYPELNASENITEESLWPLETDEDVVRAFAVADEYYDEHSDQLKRPSLHLRVQRDPNAPPPPPPPAYLDGMPDPAESTHMTMLSFYAFPPEGIVDPEEFAEMLRKRWKPFSALGRVYVAQEGVNAQMSVPSNVLSRFVSCCREVPEFQYMENGLNIDPVPLTRDEFAVAGTPGVAGGPPTAPFKNLHVRVRHKIVADGLDGTVLNWQKAGYDMPPLEWHETLKQRSAQTSSAADDVPILLDCRNTYETDVGRFEGAEPLQTESFRESWDVLKERLADTPKDAPIMTYCTGGIRCVKVGAYLTQELGFTNVSRLAGGIVAYDRTIQEADTEEESMFKGTNFVFDGRLGRPITEDDLGTCLSCGAETSLVTNCQNSNCHKRMVQCEQCRTSLMGTCSDACKQRLVNGAMRPRRTSHTSHQNSASTSTESKYLTLDEYSSGHSTPPPSIYSELEFNTAALIPSGSHMVSGREQGRFLTQLASLTRHGRILEVGTFTGYATACLWEGAINVAKVLELDNENPVVMTMERDVKAFEVAVAHLRAVAKHGTGEQGAEALAALRAKDNPALWPAPQDDIVTVERGNVPCHLMRVSDALATVEEMAAGRGGLQEPFDLIFLDADKTRLLEYADACLSSDRLLRRGGMIVVDNVLWKGLVLEASRDDSSSETLADDHDEETAELRKNRRARKLAKKMHLFNSEIAMDARAEVLVLPMRDGLSLIRKR